MARYSALRQVLRPRNEVAKFKDNPVFLRSCVRTVRTRKHWLRQGRVLQQGEESRPAKVVPHTLRGKGKRVVQLPLFGRWQTTAYKAPSVTNGIIPTNSHGGYHGEA